MTEQRITLEGGGSFWNELKAEASSYFAQPGVEAAGFRRLHRKALFIGAWAVGSYLMMLLVASTLWQVAAIGLSMVLAFAAVEFNIMHDGNHGAFSRSRRANRLAGFALEVLGGCSFTWKVKHNQAHHSYPNVDGLDEDIDQPPFARLASTQEWRPWHRWQHLYLWFVYGMVAFRWLLYGDLNHLLRKRISRYELRVKQSDLLVFVCGKLFFLGWAVGLPLGLEPTWRRAFLILVLFIVLGWLFSFLMVSVFQLAHCVDEALFTSVRDADPQGRLPNKWAVHQVLATTDFCPRNRVLTWFLGGLNFQVIHHLFAKVTHVHYPAIAGLVRGVCQRHNVEYRCQPTLRAAIASHYRHLRNMGQPPKAATLQN